MLEKAYNIFFGTLANHIPMDIANAPINNPITTLLTPSHAAPAAAAPAPMVHKGQWAFTALASNIGIKKIIEDNFLILQPHKFIIASVMINRINY